MKEILNERPQQVVISRTPANWIVTVNLNIEEVEGGFICDSHSVAVDHKPENSDIRAAIISSINANTDQKILTGLVWRGKPVWLSLENQFNFKADYDLAVQNGGETLPVRFKLGEDANGLPVYHTFTDLEEFTDFITSVNNFRNQALNDGWNEKDGIDMEPL